MKPIDPRIKQVAKTAWQAIEEKNGGDVIGLELSEEQSYTDFILIASGQSDRQVRAVADAIQEKVFKECHLSPIGVEGYEASSWILIDYGFLICHVFIDQTRPIYHLEDMWPEVVPLRGKELKSFFEGLLNKKKKAPSRVKKITKTKSKTKKSSPQKKPTKKIKKKSKKKK